MARRFNVPVVAAALLIIPVIVLEETVSVEPWTTVAALANWTIWLVFSAEIAAMLSVVPDRWGWIRRHPLELAIVLLTPPFLPASLQSARAFRLLRLLRLVVSLRRIKSFFSMEGLRYASVVAAFGVLGGGAAFAAIEKGQNLSTWDGVWFALSTVTTVGYGDVTPKTDGGRVVAMAIMIVGIGYIAMLTAAMAQFFLRSALEKGTKEETRVTLLAESEVLAHLEVLSAKLTRLEDAMNLPNHVAAVGKGTRQSTPLSSAFSRPTVDAQIRSTTARMSQGEPLLSTPEGSQSAAGRS